MSLVRIVSRQVVRVLLHHTSLFSHDMPDMHGGQLLSLRKALVMRRAERWVKFEAKIENGIACISFVVICNL